MRRATEVQVKTVLDTMQKVYKEHFTTEGLVDGHQNFEMEGGEFMEGFNFLLDAVAEGNMPESTHATALSALTLFYVYSRKKNIPGFGAVHNLFENLGGKQ